MTQVFDRRGLRLMVFAAATLIGPLLSTAFAVTVPGNFPTIQAAINAVLNGSLPDGTTIDVQAGVFGEALVIANTGKSFTVRGVSGATQTFVDAAGRNAAALTIYRATGQMVFKGLTFRNGAPPVAAGGGFVIQESSPSFVDCIFESNVASWGGGGTLITSNATFTGCIIRNNRAARSGGGVYMIDGSRPVFTQCDIIGNQSGTGPAGVGNTGVGGGVDARNSSPTFKGSRIDGNRSAFAGGGIYHGGQFGTPYGTATLVVQDSEINDNVTVPFSPSYAPAEGGAIHIEDNAVANLTRARILRNKASTGGGLNAYRARYEIVDSIVDSNQATGRTDGGFGGGISAMSTNVDTVRPASIVTLTGSLVRNNVAITGGGVVVTGDVNLPATLTLSGSVIDSNRSQSQGGGILVSRANLTAGNSMIIRNVVSGDPVSPFGGGVIVTTSSSATFNGATVAGNTGALGGGIFVDGTSALQMTGSNVYANTATGRGGGIFVNGSPSGSVQTSTIADNSGGQIQEEPCSALTYQNNTITSPPFGGCGTVTSRVSGTSSGPPRFAHVLAVPRAGTSTTLAWSVAGATSVTIAGVGSWTSPTGTVDVTPGASTTFSLTATADGGPYGAVTAGFTVVLPPSTAHLATDGDFNGDGRADITIFRPSNGTWYSSFIGTSSGLTFQWGVPTDKPVRGDYDGDGRIDVAVFRPSSGMWYWVNSSNGGSNGVQWGNGGDVPVPGDYNGDGRTDMAVFRPSTGTWYWLLSGTGANGSVLWGNGGDLPVPGDYDGDGRTDIAVYRPGNGTWYICNSQSGTVGTVQWGVGGDIPVAADYDGDGKTDIAVYRPGNGTWYVLYSSGGYAAIQWGVGGDVPVPADFDGDGKADVAVFRSGTGTWYPRYSKGGSGAFQWGVGGDVPILKR